MIIFIFMEIFEKTSKKTSMVASIRVLYHKQTSKTSKISAFWLQIGL